MAKIISLVENRSECGCRTSHALSLYVETHQHRLLFDVGGDYDVLVENAERLGVDLLSIDTVIISHGHKDHGGALAPFLELNSVAKVYVQRAAFRPHFSLRASGMADIGLDPKLMECDRVVLLDGDTEIDSELALFKVTDSSICPSGANASLYEGSSPDHFDHEQNLIIGGEQPILIMGCGHNGVVNIMERAREYSPQLCIGGFHLTSPSAKRDEPRELIDSIIARLKDFPQIKFYTCHCTGEAVYEYMRSQMSNISYLSCGERLEITNTSEATETK
ncbi:MAG: MBL fold metallo-hydrolase [Rikenellaceae bacterium]